jgi:hypothetical protein
VQEPEDGEVRREADRGDDRHEAEVDRAVRLAQALHRLHTIQTASTSSAPTLELRREHLGAPVAVAVRLSFAGRLAR